MGYKFKKASVFLSAEEWHAVYENLSFLAEDMNADDIKALAEKIRDQSSDRVHRGIKAMKEAVDER